MSNPNSPKPLRASNSRERFDTHTTSKEVRDILDNPDSLAALVGKIQREELIEHLYTLFSAHDKLQDLLTCALNRDLNATIGSSKRFSISESSLLHKILLFLIHNDLGQRYLAVSLLPLFKQTIDYFLQNSQKSLEYPDEWIEDSFIESVATDLTTSLLNTSERCPISFRESLIFLHESLSTKCDSMQSLNNIITSLCICPIIEKPHQYPIFSEKDLNLALLRSPQCLQILGKISDHLRSRDLSLFISHLLDKTSLTTLKEVVDSNRIVDVNKIKKESEIKLEMFLKSFNLGETIQNHIQYEEIKNRFMSLYYDTNGWSKIKGSKKYNIMGQTKKYEWSPLVVWKIVTTINTQYEKLKKLLLDPVFAHRNDRMLSEIRRVDDGKDPLGRREYYIKSQGFFPIATRDFLFARYDNWGERQGQFFTYSIQREDFPKAPKTVRGEIIVSGCFVEGNETDDEVKLTYIAQVDPKGSIPLFVLNKWNDGFVKELKEYHKDVKTI